MHEGNVYRSTLMHSYKPLHSVVGHQLNPVNLQQPRYTAINNVTFTYFLNFFETMMTMTTLNCSWFGKEQWQISLI